MAENVLIGPQAVPIRGREAQVATPSPQLEAVQKGTAKLDEMMGHLLRSASSQEIADQNDQAYIYYKDQINNLSVTLSGMRDFEAKKRVLDTGITTIRESIAKDYPRLSPTATKAILSEVSTDYKDLYTKAVGDEWTSAGRDAKLNLEGIKRRAIHAPEKDLNGLLKRGFDSLDNMMNNGYISKAERDDQKVALARDVTKERLLDLIARNPDMAGKIPYSAYPDPDTYFEVQSKANSIFNGKMSAAERPIKMKQLEMTLGMLNGTIDPNDPNNRKYLLPGFDKLAVQYLSTANVDNIGHRMKSSVDPEEIDNLWNDSLLMNISAKDKQWLAAMHSQAHRDATSQIGRYTKSKQDALHQLIYNLSPTKFPGMPDLDANWAKSVGEDISNIHNVATTGDAVQKQYKEIRKAIYAHFHKIDPDEGKEVPLPPGAIPAEEGKKFSGERPTPLAAHGGETTPITPSTPIAPRSPEPTATRGGTPTPTVVPTPEGTEALPGSEGTPSEGPAAAPTITPPPAVLIPPTS